jgi:sirohydrochlorin ferrochelatase
VADHPALLLVGHGSRSAAGVKEYWALADLMRRHEPSVPVVGGFIELAQPDLDAAVDDAVASGAGAVVAVPLVLLGAGHMKDDGPAALARARRRHPGVEFRYGRSLHIHPLVLAVAADRIAEAAAGWSRDHTSVVLVGRGSSDPDANADLYKVARLLQDSGGMAGVEPAFVSLASPSVADALERCRRLGAMRVAVVPYFLFTGVLVHRIRHQARGWQAGHQTIQVGLGNHLGADLRIAQLVWERYREALAGDARMNCDCCIHRAPLPGRREG